MRNKHVFSLSCKVLILLLILYDYPFSLASSTSIEETLCLRRSTHASGTYTDRRIGEGLILKVLWAAYGYTLSFNRSVPSIGGGYPLIIYSLNSSGCYRFIPKGNDLVLHDSTITKQAIKPHNQGWPSEADTVLVVVWNRTKMDNHYFASAEAGCVVQNVYLEAVSFGLGTCCVGGVSSEGLRRSLKLSQDLVPLLVMPLGYPVVPYTPSSPNYDVMGDNLPPIQKNLMSLDDTILYRKSLTRWSSQDITLQELSQLLWAAYGSTNSTHRTTPSAFGTYPLIIYILNSTGVYQYVPEKVKTRPPEYYHYVNKILNGDKREDVVTAITTNSWVKEAPSIFLITYDSEFNGGYTGDGSAGLGLDHEFIEIDAGCVIQNIFLESTALNLGATVLTVDLENWNGTGASNIRSILNLRSGIIPLYVMPVGRLLSHIRPELAVFKISQLETFPEQIKPGEHVKISFKVTNVGNSSGAKNVEVKVDGAVIFSKIQHLNVGESVLISIRTTLDSAGDHTIEIKCMKEVLSIVENYTQFNNPFQYIMIIIFIFILLIPIYLCRHAEPIESDWR